MLDDTNCWITCGSQVIDFSQLTPSMFRFCYFFHRHKSHCCHKRDFLVTTFEILRHVLFKKSPA